MPVTPALYFGPTVAYATRPHANNILNAAIQLSPRNHGQLAVGSFTYNIYVSSLVDTNAITSAHVCLYCGAPTSMIFPSWFTNSQLIEQWTWSNAGAFNPCVPPPPVAQYTWDAVTQAQSEGKPTPLIWTPTETSPVFNKPFALIATVEYVYDNVYYTVQSGSAAKDPCAAVVSSLAF